MNSMIIPEDGTLYYLDRLCYVDDILIISHAALSVLQQLDK